MRNKFILLMLMNISFCFAQTFTLQELENYAQYDFDTFSQKVMAKGYEFDEQGEIVIFYDFKNTSVRHKTKISFCFDFTATPVKNFYEIYYFDQGIAYVTTYNTSYINLMNSIKNKNYKYISTLMVNNIVRSSYIDDTYEIIVWLGNIKNSSEIFTPYYVFQINQLDKK